MEKYFTKTRILLWLVIALAVLNISTFVSIYLHERNFRTEFKRAERPPQFEGGRGMGRYIKEKLNLNKEQKEKFHTLFHVFRDSTRNLTEQMQQYRIKILDELKNQNPDTLKLYRYAREIGDLHVQMKKQTIVHYLKLKSVCTPSQQDSLAVIYSHILQSEGGMPPMPANKFQNNKWGKDGRPDNNRDRDNKERK